MISWKKYMKLVELDYIRMQYQKQKLKEEWLRKNGELWREWK